MRIFILAIILFCAVSVLAEVRFAITSDNHFKLSGQPALDCMDIVFGEKPDFIVGLGDQVDQGCDTNEWEMCIKAFRLDDPSSPPVYLAPGSQRYITCNINFYKKQIADEGMTVRGFDERNWRRYYGKNIRIGLWGAHPVSNGKNVQSSTRRESILVARSHLGNFQLSDLERHAEIWAGRRWSRSRRENG